MTWRFRLLMLFGILFGILAVPSWSQAQATITCAAGPHGERVYCAADTRGGVVLTHPRRPGLRCRQGIEWGFDARGIWVERGCAAEFEVREYHGGPWWWDSGRGHHPEPWGGVGACFYRNVGYDGPYFCLGRGESVSVLPPGFDNSISSIRVVRAEHVTIFGEPNFGGRAGRLRDDVPNLRHWRMPDSGKSWNNRISSIRVD